jgi:hypothetical protein
MMKERQSSTWLSRFLEMKNNRSIRYFSVGLLTLLLSPIWISLLILWNALCGLSWFILFIGEEVSARVDELKKKFKKEEI